MAVDQLVDIDHKGVTRPKNVPNPIADGDAANKAYVDALFEGLAWKDDVRAASTANVNLASPGASIDDVAFDVGDPFLAKDQTIGHQNGIYTWNGAAVPATRRDDLTTGPEAESATVAVREGTANGGTAWRQTATGITIGTTTLVWTSAFSATPDATTTVAGKVELATQAEVNAGTASPANLVVTPATLAAWTGAARRATADVGNASATQFDVTHNFGNRLVAVEVFRSSSPWDKVRCDVERPDGNTVRVRFAVAPSANQYTVVVIG